MADPIPADLLAPAPFADEVLDVTLEWIANGREVDADDYQGETTAERWQITGVSSAAWCMARLAQAEANLAHVAAQAEEWSASIKAWQEQESLVAARRAEFFRGHLSRYGLAQREADEECKSVKLPNGVISTRSHGPQVVVTDADWVTKWAVDNDRFDLLSMKPLVSKIREVVSVVPDPFTEDEVVCVSEEGEQVPGLAVEPGGLTVTVKPSVMR